MTMGAFSVWAELEHLHSSLTDEDRELLLQELLAGCAAGGAEQMEMVLNVWLLDPAGREDRPGLCFPLPLRQACSNSLTWLRCLCDT